MKFIHLTDTHLVPAGQALYGADPLVRLRRAVDSINREHADAAFVIVTGDLAHRGEAEAYTALREALAELKPRAQLIIGNHDDRPRFRQTFPECPVNDDGHVQYSFVEGGLLHIVLDTNEPGVSHGVFCAQRAHWLGQQLASQPGMPAHVYIHHPPFHVGIPAMDRISLLEPQHLEAALLPHASRVRHLFFGHLHRPIAGSWKGIPFSTVRGTNHQVALVLDDSPHVPGSMEPAQYAVVLADEHKTVVHLHDFDDCSHRFAL